MTDTTNDDTTNDDTTNDDDDPALLVRRLAPHGGVWSVNPDPAARIRRAREAIRELNRTLPAVDHNGVPIKQPDAT
jgi:hypothetical protein